MKSHVNLCNTLSFVSFRFLALAAERQFMRTFTSTVRFVFVFP